MSSGRRPEAKPAELDESKRQVPSVQQQLAEEVRHECGVRLPENFCDALGITELEDVIFIDEDHLKEINMKPVIRRKLLTFIAQRAHDPNLEKSIGSDGGPREAHSASLRPKPSFAKFRGSSEKWPAYKRDTLAAFGQLGLRAVLEGREEGTPDERACVVDLSEVIGGPFMKFLNFVVCHKIFVTFDTGMPFDVELHAASGVFDQYRKNR
eukprot:scaffold3750_cov239-Pinguiococcus_pyrenoidosus.AAC.2